MERGDIPQSLLSGRREDGRPHVVPVCFAWLPPYLYSAIDGKPKTTLRLRRVRNRASM